MSESSSSLGNVRQTFRPKPANIVAGTIIGLALVLGGISLAVFLAQRQERKPLDTADRIGKYAIMGGLMVVAPVGGIALLWWMKRLSTHRVTVFDNGFTYVDRGATEACPWAEVDKINEILTFEQLKVLKVPGASIKNLDRSFVVRRSDGKEFRFTVNSVDSIPRLAACLEEARERHGINWERVEVK